jgi:tetratricopeptide (TPR) repeat protein
MKDFKLLVMMGLLGFASATSAQTLEEVVEARNKGSELMSSKNFDGAIAELEKCIELSKKVGDDANEHREVAEMALPALYLQKANEILSTRDYEATLKALNETIAVAEKYQNTDVKEKAEKPLANVYYAIGATALQKNDFATAINNLDEATKHDSNNAKAYFLKGQAYQKQQNEASMSENYKLAMEKGDAGNDKNTVKNAKNALTAYFYNKGITAFQAKKYDDAISLLSQSLEADESFANAYLPLISCYESKKDWNQIIKNSEEALKLDGIDKDALNYKVGTAYKEIKDNGKACEAFKQIKSGAYLANAKYQIEQVLKCK